MCDKNDASDLDQLTTNCVYIKNYCLNNKCELNNKLKKNCDRLLDSLEPVGESTKKLKFENLPSNGYIMFINIVISLTSQIVEQIKTNNEVDAKFMKLFDQIFFYKDWLFETHKTLIDESNDSLLVECSSLATNTFHNLIHSNDRILYLGREYFAFWLPAEIQQILYYILLLIAFAYRLPFSLASLWHHESLAQNCMNAFKNANIDYPFSVWNLTEGFVFSKLFNYFVNRKIPVQSRTIHIPMQNRFRLDCKGNILDLDNLSSEEVDAYLNDECEVERRRAPGKRHRNRETIKCRYSFINGRKKVIESLEKIRNKKINRLNSFRVLNYHTACRTPDINNNETNNNLEINKDTHFEIDDEKDLEINSAKTLVIYIHGGGFFTQGSTSSEVFLRDICNNLGGVPILAIDYSLTVPFPIQNQEILDVYLWTLSGGEDVKETLGFHPKKIVLFGDSGGAFLCLTNTIILNELNKQIIKCTKNRQTNGQTNNCTTDSEILLPSSIVSAYGVISLTNMSLSKALFTLEPLIEFHLYLLMISVLGANLWSIDDFKKIENSELFKKIAAKNKDLLNGKEFKQNTNKMTNDDSSPWFMVDFETYKNYADYISSFYTNPFLAPMLYFNKFEELKSISLYAFCGDKDILLDDSIELAKQWKGKVRLDIFSDCIHGFLQYGYVSENCREAVDFVIERVQEACDLFY